MIKVPPPMAPQFAEMLDLVRALPIDQAPAVLRPALAELLAAANALGAAVARFDQATFVLALAMPESEDAHPEGDT